MKTGPSLTLTCLVVAFATGLGQSVLLARYDQYTMPADLALAGGFTTQPLKTCAEPFTKLSKDSLRYFKHYTIYGCKTQVVAGVNYRIWLKNSKREISKCTVQIFMSLSGQLSLSQREDADDCLHLLEQWRIKVGSTK